MVGANGFEPSTSWSRTRHLNPINALFGVAYGTRSAISPLLVVPNLYLAQKGSCASARSFRFAASIRSRLPWRLLALSLEAPPCRFPGSGERRCRAGALGWLLHRNMDACGNEETKPRKHCNSASIQHGRALLVEREWHAGELARAIQCFYQRHGLKGIFEVRRQGGS